MRRFAPCACGPLRGLLSLRGLLCLAALTAGCGRSEPQQPPAADVGEPGQDVDAANDGAAAAADGGPGRPPSPLLASGGFVDRWPGLNLTLPVDKGIKGSREPWVSNGLLADLDGDGDLDMVISDGIDTVWIGHTKAAWSWQFTPVLKAKAPGIFAVAVTDAAGEGTLHVAVGGHTMSYLVRQPGGAWVDQATERGITIGGTQSVRGVVPVDLDLDGLLDLAVATMSCDGSSRLHVFVNRGDGTYVERAEALGTDQVSSLWGLLATDVDDDGLIDLLTLPETCEAAAGGAWIRHRGFDAGGAAMSIQTLAPLFSHPDPNASPMGGSVGDFDNDGDLDYLFSELGMRGARMRGLDVKTPDLEGVKQDESSANHLLVNDGKGGFSFGGVEAGIAVPLSKTDLTMTAWSMRLFDFDHDGHLDIMASHGHDFESFLIGDEGGMRPVLFRNNGDATYADVSAGFGLPDLHMSRAMAAADVDDDGDLDFLFGGADMQPLLLENKVVHEGAWLRVRLRGTVSNIWGIGARLTLQTSAGLRVAEMSTQSPTETMDEPVVTFTLPPGAKAESLLVRWPGGFAQTVGALPLNTLVEVVEPAQVSLSARFTAGDMVAFTLRGFSADGTPATLGGTSSVETASAGLGKWLGSLDCSAGTSCVRQWMPPFEGSGDVTFVVRIGGEELRIRPKVRYSHSQRGG